ncbi:MAG: DUF3592 domain-containing protein [candidate division Zixibacteria bacterium]|nr:DUF3592 domain-containing protein [candidate division Zixibacteria bacterium]MDH3938411.1 DUF3592 domain-containing protein [candidate division Zixibacteria bacterium]MDH4035581.1 DUF3592 domain-containing protein [candidate division Zixibacteria bacterium]
MHYWGMVVLAFLSAIVAAGRMKQKQSGRLPSIARKWKVVSLLVMHVGVLLVIWMTGEIIQINQTANWPTQTGHIIEAVIGGGRAYRPEVRYRYTVNNQVYTGESSLNAPGFGGKRKRYDAASSLIEQFQPGDSVIVFYNPEQPSESTLSTVPTWDVFVKLVCGVFVFVIGLYVTLLPRRTKTTGSI